MACNKNQHFVPQFLLRNFAIDDEKRRVNAYAIDAERLISGASIRDQCSKDYFYSKDLEIENILTDSEAFASPIICEMLKSNSLPIFRSEQHYKMIIFFLLLGSRTQYAEEENDELINKMYKLILSKHPEHKGDVDKMRFVQKHSVLQSLLAALESIELAMDLKYKLLFNKTSLPFIICDNPITKYNILLEYKKSISSGTGIMCKGFIMMCPISPIYQLLFYDSNAYNIGTKNKSVFNISNPTDIENINKLQIINSLKAIYCNDYNILKNTLNQVHELHKYRNTDKTNISEHPFTNEARKLSTVIRSRRRDIRCNLRLSFLKLTKSAYKYELGNKAVHLRNDDLCFAFNEYQDAVHEGNYNAGQFRKFLRDQFNNLQL